MSIVDGEVRFDPGSSYDHLALGETAAVVIGYTVEDAGGLAGTGRLTLTVTGANDGPTVAAALADQAATEDAGFSFQVPAGSFADLDAADTLTYSATLADGSALPAWLAFDAATRTFSGTPGNGDVGSLDVRVTAADPHGGSVDDTFTLTTANTNDAPDDLTLDGGRVEENAATGTVVGSAAGATPMPWPTPSPTASPTTPADASRSTPTAARSLSRTARCSTTRRRTPTRSRSPSPMRPAPATTKPSPSGSATSTRRRTTSRLPAHRPRPRPRRTRSTTRPAIRPGAMA